MKISQILTCFLCEAQIEFQDSYDVKVGGYVDHSTLDIASLGFIRLFFSGLYVPHYEILMIKGESPGAGTVLYFAALDWALRHGIKEADGWVASGSTLSPDAIRARNRFQSLYGEYLEERPHPDVEGVSVHRGDDSDWRRPATDDEANMWRLRKTAPFKFIYY